MSCFSASRSVFLAVVVGWVLVVASESTARDWSDAAGKVLGQGDFVAVRRDKVVVETPDGEIISFPLEKLCAADRAYVSSQSGQKPIAPAKAEISAGNALAEKAQAALRANCYRCHGQDGASEGGFNFVLNLEKVARTHVMPNNPAGSLLLEIDLKKSQVAKQTVLARSSAGQAAAISHDGGLVAAGDLYSVRLWETKTGKELPKLQDNEIQWSAAFTPDDTRLITGGRGKINVWDVRNQRKVFSLDTAGSYYVQCLATSPDGKHVAAIPGSAGQDLQVLRIPPAQR